MEIPGVGDAIADIITKLHKTGDHPEPAIDAQGARPTLWRC